MSDQLSLTEPTIEKGARLSDDGRYRWSLWRRWDHGNAPLGFVMLNPSTADSAEDDPTIRRCVGFAKRDGYGGIYVTNLYGLRATDPSELLEVDNPVGRLWRGGPQYNPWHLLRSMCRDVVAAWGAWGATHEVHAERVREVAADLWRPLCLGTTKDGHPRHPLYVRGDQPLVSWGSS